MEPNFSSYNRSSKWKSIVLQISALIAFVALIIFTLNYIKLINLSNLSKKPVTTKTLQSAPTELRNTLPFLGCPTDNCTLAQVTKDASSSGYLINFSKLPAKTTILAVISGKLTKSGNTITIDNSERKIKVKYLINTSSLTIPANLTVVTENQPIATLGTGPNSLILSATATITDQVLKLRVSPNGKYLTNED